MAEEIDTKEFAWISEVFKKKKVFTGLSYTEREALIEDMYKISYKPEDIIFKEGDDPTACFLIYKGKVKGTKNKMLVLKKEVSTLGPGSFFGEMAFSPMRHAWRPLLREKTRSVLFCLNPPSSDCWKKIPPLNAGWNHSRPNAWQN